MARMWRSEDNLWKLVLSVHHTHPGNPIQVIKFDSKHLYMLSHLTSSLWVFEKVSGSLCDSVTHCVAKAGFELLLSCLYLLSTVITGM